MQLRALGQSEPIPNSSITTSSTKAGTLRPGNSRNSFQKRFARASDHCAVDHLSQFATVHILVPRPLLVASTLHADGENCNKRVSPKISQFQNMRLSSKRPWCSAVSRRSPAKVATSMACGRVKFHSRPGSRVWISRSSQPLPSGSSNEANE
jgi:hypothetical protein